MNEELIFKGRLINVSNRLPVKLTKTFNGISYTDSEGGLATALSSIISKYKSVWIGWPGSEVNEDEAFQIQGYLASQQLHPVFLSERETKGFYEGMSNDTIWPLFHYFPAYSSFKEEEWKIYKSVNKKYAAEILKFANDTDIVWIHDYHLMLVPQMVRDKRPNLTIGFFNHIPFPSYEIFRALPWRKEILNGLLGADIIGLQTANDTAHFINSSVEILGIQDKDHGLFHNGRFIQVRHFPISIDYKKFVALANDSNTIKDENEIKSLVKDKSLIISVDRLDYSKGIIQRLKSFATFLTKHPEWHERVTFFHLVVPSRDSVKRYADLRQEMNKIISEINGKFSTVAWHPIQHFYRSVSPNLLAALYKLADVALVTPLHDGMNLVSKEFVAGNINSNGVLILSETAGAAKELNEAIIVNPNDISEYSNAILQALTLPVKEKKLKMVSMKKKIAKSDIFHWANTFITELKYLKKLHYLQPRLHTNHSAYLRIQENYRSSRKRLLVFDYDGTLVPLVKDPKTAKPDSGLQQLLNRLSNDDQNTIVISSGRTHTNLEEWLGEMKIILHAEHGLFSREPNKDWTQLYNAESKWKKQLKDILLTITKLIPGSSIEEKPFSIAWHYRNSGKNISTNQIFEISNELQKAIKGQGLEIIHGNKILEIKSSSINKGKPIEKLLSQEKYDFIMAIGDDTTDEEIFKVLDPDAFTIKVGADITRAKYFINSPEEVREMLGTLSSSYVTSRNNIFSV